MQRPWGKEGLAGVEFHLTSNWKWAELRWPSLLGSEKAPSLLTRAHQGLPARWGGGSSK